MSSVGTVIEYLGGWVVFAGQPYADGGKYRIDPGGDAGYTLTEDAGLRHLPHEGAPYA